jgi:hypothetical protein
MAIKTYIGEARSAWLQFTNSIYWMALGQTSAWPNEPIAPSEVAGTTDIAQAIVFVKAEFASLCYPINTNPDVTIRGQGYKFCTSDTAIANMARYVYLRGRFDPSTGQPYGTFRQFGVFTNLIPAANHTTDTWLTPVNVLDRGNLEYLENNTPTIMSVNRQEIIEVIL